jgi:hypothetical protein
MRGASKAEVPGPWNRDEREFVLILKQMEVYAQRAVTKRLGEGLSANYDKARAAALNWALVEIEKSRAALGAARGGGK